ncbi:acyl-CoA dehydrogenase family protein [Streptomyces sp. NPDC053431]|uniref:acyl-CoA dehydrogenase family protein n=1 Tax=Streptomyces sp. NPDC053431 TaxID=3365703 RepID=UPI0037D2CC0E
MNAFADGPAEHGRERGREHGGERGREHERELAELRAAVRAVLARHEGAQAWDALTGQVGAAGLLVPERYGGLGCGPAEVAVVGAELGRSLSPLPYLGSAVLAVTALIASGDEEGRDRLLPALADGSAVGALAWAEERDDGGDPWSPGAIRTVAEPGDAAGSAGPWLLTGRKEYVLVGDGRPDVLLAFARERGDGRLGVYELTGAEAGFGIVPTLDRTRPLGRVVLRRAPARRLGDVDGETVLGRVRDAGAVALAAEQVGGAEQALAETVAHVRQRVQFGRVIGSFQAVRHRLADLYAAVASARALTSEAARAEPHELSLLAAAARSAASEAYQEVAAETVQLHGGIGITWEHVAHDHLKRAHGAAWLLGAPAGYRGRIAAGLGLPVPSAAGTR